MDCIVTTPVNIYRCEIGNKVKIGPFVEIQGDVVVGDNTVISSHSFICAGTKIGSNVFIGHGVLTCNDRYPKAYNPGYLCQPPTIEDGANIGSGAIILPGVRICSGATVGAGCIVTKDVPAGATVYGKH
jgi:UDP-2-acetamido-3-amino-2,3-dideoxy-glucuronate N-acetyltransferase